MDTKPGYKKWENTPQIKEMPKIEPKKTLDDYIQDIKNIATRNGGNVKTLERYETGGKISSIELTLSFKVH